MKQFIVITLMILMSHLVIGQHQDPTYSANNYKHLNKAAYARKYKSDKTASLEPTLVKRNDNYKQPHNRVRTSKSFAFAPKAVTSKRGTSYKHPYGL